MHDNLSISQCTFASGAKQLPPTTQLAPGQSPQGQDKQRQRAPDHQEAGQRNHPSQPPQGHRRNPVQDLAAWCRSLGKPEPRYDFVGQVSTYSLVTVCWAQFFWQIDEIKILL